MGRSTWDVWGGVGGGFLVEAGARIGLLRCVLEPTRLEDKVRGPVTQKGSKAGRFALHVVSWFPSWAPQGGDPPCVPRLAKRGSLFRAWPVSTPLLDLCKAHNYRLIQARGRGEPEGGYGLQLAWEGGWVQTQEGAAQEWEGNLWNGLAGSSMAHRKASNKI